MKRWTLFAIGAVTLCGLGVTVATADNRLSVPVAFGRGLDTAQPGNPVNHAILPDTIKVTEGGVVHFLVSGFHQIAIYNQGTDSADIVVPPAGTTFINDPTNRSYLGIAPAGGPPPGTAPTINPSNASNRVESVSFREQGTFLVICNVRGHFLDGMFAVVKVKEAEDD